MLVLSRKLWLWAFVVIPGLVVYLVSCNGKATQPQHVPDEPKDYRVYFCNPEPVPKLFIYHPVTRHLDSMDLPWSGVRYVTASADGQRLYLTLENSVIVVESDSLTFIAELPHGGRGAVAVSSDGKLLAVAGKDLYILRTTDYSIVYHDTTSVGSVTFSTDNSRVYGAIFNQRKSYELDLADSTRLVGRTVFADGAPMQLVPTPDESKWLLYLISGGDIYAFEVYDVQADSIVFAQDFCGGPGQIAIMPNGKYAFYGNPASFHSPGSSDLMVFDIESNRIDEVVNTEAFIDSLTPYYFPVGSMVVTPDNRWLIAQDGVTAHSVLLYDIEQRELVDYHTLGFSNVELGNLTVQKQE